MEARAKVWSCSSTSRQEAKQEQVGQTCSKEDCFFFLNLRVVTSRARACESSSKLAQTTSAHYYRGAPIVGLGGPPGATNDQLRICTPLCHLVRSLPCTKTKHTWKTCSDWDLSKHWRRDPGVLAAGGPTSGSELSGRGGPFRIICLPPI